jgi:hypothetical protein
LIRINRLYARLCCNRVTEAITRLTRETEARLRRNKFDNLDINAEVFVQARASFEMFDRLTQLAQTRRIGLLREISLRRELARRVIGTHGL